jgi:heat shock protein HslJ
VPNLKMVCLAAILSACSPASPPPTPTAPATAQPANDPAALLGPWIVTSAGGQPVEPYAAENNEGDLPYFKAYGGQLHGILTCNGFTADYKADAGSIKISAPLQTEQGCTPQEARVAAGLRDAAGWRIAADGVLTLTGSGLTARRPGETDAVYELYGAWKVLSVNGAAAAQPADAPALITFQRDSMAAFSTCAQYTGGYTVSRNQLAGANEIQISTLTSDTPGCDPEKEFFAALEGETEFRTLPDGRLELIGPSEFVMIAEPY